MEMLYLPGKTESLKASDNKSRSSAADYHPGAYPYHTRFVDSCLSAAISQGLPVAVWKLPNDSNRHLVVDLSGKAAKVRADLSALGSGFIVSPFNNRGDEALFIRADLHYSLEQEGFIHNFSADDPLLVQNRQAFEKKLYHYFYAGKNVAAGRTAPNYFTVPAQPGGHQQEHFMQSVAQGVEAIRRGDFLKVVLSRTMPVALPVNFDLAATFERLCELYPTAFVSLVSIPGLGTWVGASPETLISIDRHSVFRTVALAGTQPLGDLQDLNEAQWRQKEIEEQAMVSRYIINCFKQIRLREFEEYGPRTAAAGNLIHLKTDFVVDMIGTDFPQLGTVMLNLLHPTSAVCGMPKAAALEFIHRHENYNRQLYSGYLGAVNMEKESHIFVNLRCMQVFDKSALLYAGAGITRDSVPEKEWQETELKCKTMLRALS